MKHPVYTLVLTASLCACAAVTPRDLSAQTLAPQPVTDVLQKPSSTDFTPSLGGIFADTLTDFRRLPSLDSAVILSIGGIAASVGHPSDVRFSNSFSTGHPSDVRFSNSFSTTESMKGPFSAGQTLGAATTQLAGAFATYSIGRMTGNQNVAVIGADLVRAQFVSQTVTQVIKFSAQRTRPDGTTLSFPSGHTSSAFATASVLQRHLGWKAGVPAYGLAAYIAASRIQMKRHYLSDVAFGAAIGIMAGRTVTIGRGDARFAVSPVAAPGGAGVNFTWVGKK